MTQPKVGFFFGSNTGTTELIAKLFKTEFEQQAPNITVDIHDIGLVAVSKMLEYESLVVASPTWNIGELQDDWELKFSQLDDYDFTGKAIALLGVGDQYGYPDNFVDAIGILGKKFEERGADLIAFNPTYGYEFDNSLAVVEEVCFMGLALDDVNQVDETPHRLAEWVMMLVLDFGFVSAGLALHPAEVHKDV